MLFFNKSTIFYEKIDYLTLRVSSNTDIFKTCCGLVSNASTLCLEFGYILEYRDTIKKGQLSIIDLYDSQKNKLGQLRIVLSNDNNDCSLQNELEFTSTFFVFYKYDLDYFMDLFEFKRDKNGLISRVDYAIDVYYTVNDLFYNYKYRDSRTNSRQIGKDKTWFLQKNQRHEVSVYNKPLEVVDKKKYKMVSSAGEYPFNDWIIQQGKVITRVEYRKNMQAMRDMQDSSWNYLENNIRSLALQYLDGYFYIDSEYEKISYGKDKIELDVIYTKEIERKKAMALSRMESYMDSYIELGGELQIFILLYRKFGLRLYNSLHKRLKFNLNTIFEQHIKQKKYLSLKARINLHLIDILTRGKYD